MLCDVIICCRLSLQLTISTFYLYNDGLCYMGSILISNFYTYFMIMTTVCYMLHL